jgi:ubiquinone/menaquinone biosynthesis C-methylase UbiE
MSRHEAELQKLFGATKQSLGDGWEDAIIEGMNRVTLPLARRMLDQAAVTASLATPIVLFDNGCGLGVVAAELQTRLAKEVMRESTLLSGDISAQIIDSMKMRIEREGWVNTEARIIDAQVRVVDAHL